MSDATIIIREFLSNSYNNYNDKEVLKSISELEKHDNVELINNVTTLRRNKLYFEFQLDSKYKLPLVRVNIPEELERYFNLLTMPTVGNKQLYENIKILYDYVSALSIEYNDECNKSYELIQYRKAIEAM